MEHCLPEENLRVTEVAAWQSSLNRHKLETKAVVHSTIPACLHTVPEAVLVPLPAPHRQALSSASTEKSEKDYSDIKKKKIDVQTYIFGIIAFAN